MENDGAADTKTYKPETDARHFRDVTTAYALFLAISLFGLLLYRFHPDSQLVLLAVLLVPYPVAFLAALGLRAAGHPRFPLGGARDALTRHAMLWTLAISAVGAWLAFRGEFGAHSAGHRIAKFFTYSVADPLAEEFVFRGIIQTSLNFTFLGTHKVGGLQGGTIAAAALFAIMHFLNLVGNTSLLATLVEAVTAFPAALLFGYIYQRTQNIWYGVFLHGLSNLVMA